MLARRHCFEQLNVVVGKRIECPHSTAGRCLLWCCNVVELLDCGRRIVDHCERFQLSTVGLPGNFLVAEKISYILPHRNPLHDSPVFTSDLLSDFEFFGIIDHHLYPKNRTGFIVQLQLWDPWHPLLLPVAPIA